MSSLLVLLLILGIAASIFWLLRVKPARRQQPHKPGKQKVPDRETGNQLSGGLEKLRKNEMFWGASITQAGCEAARELVGQKFSFDDAPELPVEGCSEAICTCRLQGLTSRRKQHRRTKEERREAVRFDKDSSDRRSRKDRRSGNWDDHSY